MVGSKKWEDLLWFGIILMSVIILNQLFGKTPFRWDLTEEKRFTIQQPTKDLLNSLEDVVYVDVYLEEDLPSGFARLRKAIFETLEEFRLEANGNLQYRYQDPNLAKSDKARQEFYFNLAQKGISGSNVIDKEDGTTTQKLVFPGAIVSYGGREAGVLMLKGNKGAGPEEQLNQSIEGIEYELAMAIRQITQDRKKAIGFVQGHGELDSLDVIDIQTTLAENYDLKKLQLDNDVSLLGLDAVVIAKPVQPFQEYEKYLLDQYIMGGGKVLFFLDALRVNMDSVGGPGTYAFPYDTQLSDLLFSYGLRINLDLVVDGVAQKYPVVVGNVGNQPQVRWLDWPFYPLANYLGKHPVVRNIDAVSMRFASSIDTVKANGISKTPLLFSSRYSKKAPYPVKVSFNELRKQFNPETFNQGPIPLAYLLEGSFTSAYKNRILPDGSDAAKFRPDGENSKILVISDGDFLRNDINPRNGQPLPLGFDLQSQLPAFANKDFITNALAYLTDDQGIINARAKEVRIRPLDKFRIEKEKLKWQMINLVLPLVVLILYGVVRYYLRKRRFTRFTS
ncbi:MAG: gliding motility-associated ABC transporter substrate-binding protein GldG [Cyclobacteriaceae bacterium]